MERIVDIKYNSGNTILSGVADFDIDKIFDCGQCFRFEKTAENSYSGVAFGKLLKASQNGNDVVLHGIDRGEFENIWYGFFDLDTDYSLIRQKIATDDIIKDAMKKGEGIRILRQDLWETIISFIVSQNNNIPRIKGIISKICSSYGETIDDAGSKAFPTCEALASAGVAQLHALGLGYRDEYISAFSRSVAEGSFSLDDLKSMDTPKARKTLLDVKGIGGKVADCILLFGMSRYEVCPHDVWVKRIFSEKYNIEKINEKKGYALATGKWGEYAGIAQQYLFYAERDK